MHAGRSQLRVGIFAMRCSTGMLLCIQGYDPEGFTRGRQITPMIKALIWVVSTIMMMMMMMMMMVMMHL